MSLLKRIESARPGAGPGPDGSNVPVPTQGGAGGGTQPPASATQGRLMTQAPVRESFRDVKFRIQNRVIQDLDPKLDLSNREAQVSQDVLRLASAVVGTKTAEAGEPAKKSAQKKSLFAWR